MIVLVVGATSWLAGHLVPRLAAEGHTVYAAGHDRARLSTLRGATPILWDLAVPALPGNLPDQIDAAVYVAQANVPVPDQAVTMFEVNAAGVVRTLDYARRAGARRVVFTSSGSVYGAAPHPLREDDPLAGHDFYSATKIAAERAVQAFSPSLGTTILRLFAPYGPGQSGRLIPGLINRVRSGQPATLKEGRGPRFNPVYVDHVVDVVAQALAAEGHHLLNVGGGEALSVREMAESIGLVVGRQPVFQDQPGDIGGDVVGDTTRLRQTFRLPDPLVGFEEGIRRILATEEKSGRGTAL